MMFQRRSVWAVYLSVLGLVFALDANTPAQAAKVLKTQTGKASYYGKRFDGRRTASGVRFDSSKLTAAHPSWPFGTVVRVTNQTNKRSVELRIIDRGPTKRVQRRGVIIDVSLRAAQELKFVKRGIVPVKVEVLKWGKRKR